ncbi:MAG: OmpA family protein [Paludibacteraceae bacterium]|nr:OmpA family protein [Paludibacteraceae bacterium]
MSIKNRIGSITLAMSLATVSFAQTAYYKHNIDMTVGGGLQSIKYKSDSGNQDPALGGVLNFNYRYMMNEHWGIGTGLGIGLYNAKTNYYGLFIKENIVNYDEGQAQGQTFEFRSNFDNWNESQYLLDFEVPAMIYFMTPMKSDKWSFLSDFGIKFNIPMWNKFKVTEGTLETSGYFGELTNIEYKDLPQHGFGTYTTFTGKADLRSVGASVIIDAGFLRKTKQNRSFYFGPYFAYRFTNLSTPANNKVNLYDAANCEYVGMASSNIVSKTHIMSAGIKIGLSIGLPNDYRMDSDLDGVVDHFDICSNTPVGVSVDSVGCPVDSDKDGVPDYIDKCPGTPEGIAVNSFGCPQDSDEDGVPDYLDKCPNTPARVKVNSKGCPIDSDMDGVPDYLDKCPNTPQNISVDETGCPIDTDGDGVPDYLDKCPETPGNPDMEGCPKVMKDIKATLKTLSKTNVHFEDGKTIIKPTSYFVLNLLVELLNDYPNLKVQINGHTDNFSAAYKNLKLSQERAMAIKFYLIEKGINPARLTSEGYGNTRPMAGNNNRIEFIEVR